MVQHSKLAKTLKTLTTDITGESLVLKINNAVWLILKAEFDITQSNWNKEFEENEVVAGMKLLVSLLKANDYHYALEDIANNTDQVEILKFLVDYQMALFGKETIEETTDEAEGK